MPLRLERARFQLFTMGRHNEQKEESKRKRIEKIFERIPARFHGRQNEEIFGVLRIHEVPQYNCPLFFTIRHSLKQMDCVVFLRVPLALLIDCGSNVLSYSHFGVRARLVRLRRCVQVRWR